MGETGPCVRAARFTSIRATICRVRRCPRGDRVWVRPGLRSMDRNLELGLHAVRATGRRTPACAPSPSVDTEWARALCAVLQGVRSNYETDLLRPWWTKRRACLARPSSRRTTSDRRSRCARSRTTPEHGVPHRRWVFPDKTAASTCSAASCAGRVPRLVAGHQPAVPGGSRRPGRRSDGDVYPS